MPDPNMRIEDVPENYVNLTYELSATRERIILTITQGDFDSVENGRQRMEDSKNGWEMVIPRLKELVES